VECPGVDVFHLLVAGELPADQRARVADHAATCRACHELVAALVTQHGGSVHYGGGGLVLGKVIGGRFRIDDVLGVGGMGVVVAATHLELGTRVALKFLRDEMLGSAAAGERFVREARAVVRLRTEHVCKVIDVARLDNGAPYIVMELLDGTDLARTILKQPLPMTIAVEYVMQACIALAEAHGMGIVHRDLKPANLFVTRGAGGGPLVKVLDFGIAKAMFDADAGLTLTRVMLGSPGYMSPEQLESARSVDARSDIWALGVTLYQLLSARLPFGASTPTAVAIKIATEPPEPLSVDPALRAIVLRCLDKAPANRYPDVAALATDLIPFGGPSARRIAAAVGRPVGTQPAPMAPVAPSRAVVPLSQLTQATGASVAAPGAPGWPIPTMAPATGASSAPLPPGASTAQVGQSSRGRQLVALAGVLGLATVIAFAVARSRTDGASDAPGKQVVASAPIPDGAPAPPPPDAGPPSTSVDARLGTLEALLAPDAGVPRPGRGKAEVAGPVAASRPTTASREPHAASPPAASRERHAGSSPADDPAVREALRGHAGEIEQCVRNHGEPGAARTLTIRVAFTLGVDGRATGISATGASSAVIACAIAVIHDAVLPPPLHGAMRLEHAYVVAAPEAPRPAASVDAGAGRAAARESLTNDELLAGVRQVQARLIECANYHHKHGVTLRALVAVSPSGNGRSVALDGAEHGTTFEDCLSWVVRDGRWPATRSGGMISVPFTFP